jgi:hypothetical protein
MAPDGKTRRRSELRLAIGFAPVDAGAIGHGHAGDVGVCPCCG